ncbi:hypothetical protein UY3_03383 [Chelonia mydas]|uniref:Uncharacterized protein n=1 Tax=Chelonia mydas TaxID=8469 RepID=M7BNC2_CHEMY|nr:hypothetical protein UY3_03383 [Chelonia mydas]
MTRLRTFSYVNNVAEVDVLRPTHSGVFATVTVKGACSSKKFSCKSKLVLSAVKKYKIKKLICSLTCLDQADFTFNELKYSCA